MGYIIYNKLNSRMNAKYFHSEVFNKKKNKDMLAACYLTTT